MESARKAVVVAYVEDSRRIDHAAMFTFTGDLISRLETYQVNLV